MNIEDKIKSEILSTNKDIRLDSFINKALFEGGGYYYNKKPIGIKNDFITAKSYALEGVAVNSRSSILFSQLAFLENENKLYNSAVEFADKALSIDRRFGPALIELARANVYLCNSVAAAESFKAAKRYDRSQVAKLEKWATEHYKTVCKK